MGASTHSVLGTITGLFMVAVAFVVNLFIAMINFVIDIFAVLWNFIAAFVNSSGMCSMTGGVYRKAVFRSG